MISDHMHYRNISNIGQVSKRSWELCLFCWYYALYYAGAPINVISIFSNLEKMYVLFSKSQEIHQIQMEQKLKVFSFKRINTVRWSSS